MFTNPQVTRSEFPVQQIKATVPAEVVIGKRFLRCLEALLELPGGMHHAAGCLAIECRNPNYKPWQVWVYQFKNEGLSDLESNEVKLVKGSESIEQQGIISRTTLVGFNHLKPNIKIIHVQHSFGKRTNHGSSRWYLWVQLMAHGLCRWLQCTPGRYSEVAPARKESHCPPKHMALINGRTKNSRMWSEKLSESNRLK